jgi:hypothetical protein
MLIAIASVLVVWVLLGISYVSLCRIAARGERRRAVATPAPGAPVASGASHEGIPASLASGLVIWENSDQSIAEAQRPRRSRTWATVRSKIFMSLHKDQFATYR